MIELLVAITFISLSVPVYVYVGYPLLLYVLSKIIKGKRTNKRNITPTVSMIISCFNEIEIIEQKLKNCLVIDYPKDRLDFVFVSDGSDDGTDDVIQQYSNERISLIRQEGRLGKSMGLNLAVPRVKGEIVVFSDANAMYQTNAIQMLVRNFNDNEIGYVVGAALYKDETKTPAGSSEQVYWQYEIFLKQIESKLHSVVGGDGAIYAIRKTLYEWLDQEDINDFVNPLQIITKGFRGVFETEAICYEQTAGNFSKEAKRKQRIVNRSFTALLKNKAVLNPFKYGFYSFELLSHKLLRWLIPFFIILGGLGTVILAQWEVFVFQLCLLLGILFIWSVMLGNLLRSRQTTHPAILYPYYFYLVNINSLIGVLQSLRGKVQVTWSTARASKDYSSTRQLRSSVVILLIFILTIWIFAQTLKSVT